MKKKPVIPRAVAARDIEQVISYHVDEEGVDLALRFVDALEAAFGHISANPAAGSQRYAAELDLPDLRFWPLKRFPYLIFYIEREDHIDVWRVLHGKRDIPTRLQLSE